MKHLALLLLVASSTLSACSGGAGRSDANESTSQPVETTRGRQFMAYANPYGDGRPNPLARISGSVNVLTVTAADVKNTGIQPSTRVTLVVYGAAARASFPAHVHQKPCAPPDKGGGHYQDVPGGPADETNEIHLDFTSDALGFALAHAEAPFAVRSGEAKSIVIHDPNKDDAGKYPKLACVDVAF